MNAPTGWSIAFATLAAGLTWNLDAGTRYVSPDSRILPRHTPPGPPPPMLFRTPWTKPQTVTRLS